MKSSETVNLTPAQRLHFDIYGFVLLENVLTPDEVARMKGRAPSDESRSGPQVQTGLRP